MKSVDTLHELSAAQKQLLAGQLLATEKPICNMALAYTIEGPVDTNIMQCAWDQVASKCDALGIRIVFGSDRISQVTGHSWPVLDLMDCSQQSHPQQYAESWMQRSVAEAIQPDAILGSVTLIKLTDRRWVFFCNLHHVICDATSFSYLWQELASQYSAIANPSHIAVKTQQEPTDYIAFVETTNHAQNDRTIDQSHYLSHLQNIAPPAPFGCRPGRDDTASTRVMQVLDNERIASLAALSALPQARGFGPGIGHCSVLLTLLATLLYRIGGGSTQTIGLPLPQRKNISYKYTFGLLIEVLPLQVTIEDDSTFLTLVDQARAAFLTLLKDGKAGDSALLEAGTHAIPTILNYINAPMGDFGEWPARVEWLHSGHIDSQHLIRLQVMDWAGDGNLALAFDFNDAVFDETQRIQTIEAFWCLFDAMAMDVDLTVDSVAITHPRLLVDTNPNVHSQLDSRTVTHRIGEQMNTLGERCALVQGNQSLSYTRLSERVRNTADYLTRIGVEQGSRVAVVLPRDIRLPQVLLSVHACSACYVPIDSNQPVARIRDILDNANPRILISTPELGSDIDFDTILMVDDLLEEADGIDHSVASRVTSAEALPALSDIAYVMYTSGSTGTPKGVAISHQALANYADWAAGFYADDKAVDMALFTPVGFDLTVTSLILPLMTGGTLHIYEEGKYSAIEALSAVFEDDNVDIVKLTPAHLGMLTDELCAQTKRLSQIIVGGEDLPAILASRIYTAFNARVRIHNEYGPTEATVGCVLHTYEPDADTLGSVPIGLPIAGSSLRILNRDGQDQLPGCSGELYVAGPSLANGYWGQEALSQSQFQALPPNLERFYRTGDIVREGQDGYLRFQGRANEQFKLRGHRIEPAEIESAALQHPAISTCVAVLTNLQTAVDAQDKKCSDCGLSSRVPGAKLDASGVCEPCRHYVKYKDRVEAYFRPMQEFRDTLLKLKEKQQSEYDCIMLLSGGKDSCYALAQLVDMELRVLALTLDNGFISQSAKDNAKRVCDALGVEHRYASTPSMNTIFLDSLQRHANVCNGCFKTIYTFALQLACELKINCIVTGLSRGQFFETRLSEDWFMTPDYQVEAMDEAIVAARKTYHRIPDAVSNALDTDFLQDDSVFERVQILDFYRYCNVSLDEIYHYLETSLSWVRPSDTGRSTNCLINDAGIYVHQYERGFHNYANPYSWDVRLGHKDREAALEELDDQIDEKLVKSQLAQIGYQLSDNKPAQIALYYVTDTELAESELKHWLAMRLPEWMLPVWLVELPTLPLSSNGKIDRRLLPVPVAAPIAVAASGVPRALVNGLNEASCPNEKLPPQTENEKLLARIWCRHLRLEVVGVNENFFALGGDSLMAIRIVSELNKSGYRYKPVDVFDYQTIAQLAQVAVTSREQVVDANIKDNEVQEKPVAFAGLSASQLNALSRVMKKMGSNE